MNGPERLVVLTLVALLVVILGGLALQILLACAP